MKNIIFSMLTIAMNNRVKLIYRPTDINAEKQLKLELRGNDTWLNNPTPYYMAITSVKHDGKDIPLSDNVAREISQLKPLSEMNLEKKVRGKISADAINDRGEVQNYEIH